MARILIADDEDLERQALSLIISEAPNPNGEGFSIAEAKNGPEALSLGLRNDFDVIFLDVKMPGMDGIAVAEGLRNANIQSAIVIVSAYDTFEYAQKAIRLGVYEYLLKPASREDVLRALTRSLELQRAGESVARLKRESATAMSSAVERLEGQIIREMERGALLEATALDFERLSSLEGRPKAALAFRLDAGGVKIATILDKAFIAMVMNEATSLLPPPARIICAVTKDSGRLLVYDDTLALAKEADKKTLSSSSPWMKNNLFTPLIRVTEEKLKSLAPYRLFWGCSGPSTTEPTSLLFSRALEACHLAYTDCPLVCLTPHSEGRAKSSFQENPIERPKPGLALRALDALKEDCARDWSLEVLAKSLGISPFHLSHVLSRELGMGFSELLQRLRIEKAKEVLAGGASAKEASYLLGFSDQAYFTRVFKKLEGRTPCEYQDEIAKKYQ
jgi:two-component system response regulator YesN